MWFEVENPDFFKNNYVPMYLIEPVSSTEGTIPSLNKVTFTWVHASQGISQVALEGKNLPASAET